MKGIRIQYQQLTKKIQSLLINTKPEVSFNLSYRKLSGQFFKLTQILLEQIDVDKSIQQAVKQTIDKFKVGVNKYNQQQISDSEDQSEFFNTEYDEVKNFINQFHQNTNSNDEIERNALYKYLSDVSYKQKNIDDLMKHMDQNKRNNFQLLHRRVGGSSGNQSLIISNVNEQTQTDLSMNNIRKMLDQYSLECREKESTIIQSGTKQRLILVKKSQQEVYQANKEIKQQQQQISEQQQGIKKNQQQKRSSKNSNNSDKTKNLQQKRINNAKAKQTTNAKLKNNISKIKRVSKNKQPKLDNIRSSIQVQVNSNQLPPIIPNDNPNIYYLNNNQCLKSLQEFSLHEETNLKIVNKSNRVQSKTNFSKKSEVSSNIDNQKIQRGLFETINQPESTTNVRDRHSENSFSTNKSKESQIRNNKYQNNQLPRKTSHYTNFSKDLPIAAESIFQKKYHAKLVDCKKTNTVHLQSKKGARYTKSQQDQSVIGEHKTKIQQDQPLICEQKTRIQQDQSVIGEHKTRIQHNINDQLKQKKDSLKQGLHSKILKQHEKNITSTTYNKKSKQQLKHYIAEQHFYGQTEQKINLDKQKTSQTHPKINLDKQNKQNYPKNIQQIQNNDSCYKQTKRRPSPSLDHCNKPQIVFPPLTKNIHHQSHHQQELNPFLYKYTTFCSLSNSNNKKCYNPSLLQNQKKMIRQIQQLCQHASQRNNKQVAMFIQFIQAMHKRECGDKCQHLEKFYEFLKKKSIPHRQQIIIHKKDLMFQ